MNDIAFIETDPNIILEKLVKDYEELTGETLYPGDERRIFLYNQAQIIVSLKTTQNEGLKSNLVRYARKDKLDSIGEFTDTLRLGAKFAKSKAEFVLKATLSSDFIISKGTKLTPDGKLFFETSEDLIIHKGDIQGIIDIQAVEPGSKYNGFLPGQIKNLVMAIDNILEVSNIDTTSGGSLVEDDENYRNRIRLAPKKFSVAGPDGAYEYHAKSSHNLIEDVKVFSPSPGVVRLVILLKDGEIPTKSILDTVYNNVSAKDKRPLTDKVEVTAPNIVNYDINITYYILKENYLDENKIKLAVNEAVEAYKLWQKSTLGKSINPDYLRKLILNAGVNRVVVTAPSFQNIDIDKVSIAKNINVVYGGLD